MSYIGSWKIDDALTFYVVTTRVDTGTATDADAAPAYRVYEDETTTPILTGNMALLDGANTAGLYSEQITLSAANGLEKGKSYAIHIAATVNSVAGATVHTFQIEAEVDANAVSNLGANVVTAASIADGAIDAATFASGAITAASIATDAIGAAELASDVGADLASIPWNAAWDAEVQSEVADALNAAIADSVPADGSAANIPQALYMILQFLTEKSISSTTMTVNKPDGSTALMTFTLSDATNPTSITRAS